MTPIAAAGIPLNHERSLPSGRDPSVVSYVLGKPGAGAVGGVDDFLVVVGLRIAGFLSLGCGPGGRLFDVQAPVCRDGEGFLF